MNVARMTPAWSKTTGAGEERNALPFPDPWLLITVLLLLALGLLMVTSASMPMADRQTGQPFYFLIRQGAFVLIGLIAGGLVFQIPTVRWREISPLLLLAALGMLILFQLSACNAQWFHFPLKVQEVFHMHLRQLF